MANDPAAEPTDPNTDPVSTEPNGAGTSEEDIKAAKAAGIDDFIKSMGVGSADELKNIIAAQNDTKKANQTDLKNAQDDLKTANNNNADLTSKVASLEASNAVLKAGVTSDHMEDATILAQAKVANGSAKDFDKAIKDVLKSNPQFAGDVKTGPDGAAIVNSNTSNNNSSLTKAEFDKMDYGDRLKVFSEQPETYKKFTK